MFFPFFFPDEAYTATCTISIAFRSEVSYGVASLPFSPFSIIHLWRYYVQFRTKLHCLCTLSVSTHITDG